MFKRSFNKFLEKPPDKPELYPYIYSIGFKGLTKSKNKITTEPIKCSQCGAVLTNVESIKDDPNIGPNFTCEFCGTVNVVNKEQIIEKVLDDIDFILEDIQEKTGEKITSVSAGEGELYISVIDISGSMSGAKIEAVRKSLIQTVQDFKINLPTTRYFLIAFESSVYYYLKHDKNPTNFSGELLHSLEGMRSELEKSISEKDAVGSIGEFADGWISKIKDLRTMDMTALGPALFFAIISFELFKFPSGRITLLTDGLANQGIGNLSGTSTTAEKFYDEMAELCNKNNIIVDIVGVSSPGDNSEMGLQTLGKITDKTGGKMFLISDQEMSAAFSELQQTNFIGKDVKVKVITPANVNIKNISGAYSSQGEIKESSVNLGAVTEERELFVELDSSTVLESDEDIPIQLQVEYKDKEGRKRLRILNDRVKVTKDEKEFKSEYDQKLNVMMNIQQSGTEYYAGKAEKSKNRLKSLKKGIMNEMKDLGGAGAVSYGESIEYLDDELDEMEMEEEKIKHAPAKSFMASQGQVKARLSELAVKERIERKKKKQ